jgi:hypothetical protein
MMAAQAMTMNLDGIIDAEFETVLPARRAEPAPPRAAVDFSAAEEPADGLELLRANSAAQPDYDQPEQLTPGFLFFTAVAALAVFWVSGGHALLY